MKVAFKDKVALVTGRASRLGLATANAFGEAGSSVILAEWNEKEVQAVAKVRLHLLQLLKNIAHIVAPSRLEACGEPVDNIFP